MKIDDTPRATSKNLDVLAEFEKKKAKHAANFVVIGKFFGDDESRSSAHDIRSRRCRQKYVDGTIAI